MSFSALCRWNEPPPAPAKEDVKSSLKSREKTSDRDSKAEHLTVDSMSVMESEWILCVLREREKESESEKKCTHTCMYYIYLHLQPTRMDGRMDDGWTDNPLSFNKSLCLLPH